ncbi:hypothetical protein GCM10027605_21730 [Micromonospora zhanjiangensis]
MITEAFSQGGRRSGPTGTPATVISVSDAEEVSPVNTRCHVWALFSAVPLS